MLSSRAEVMERLMVSQRDSRRAMKRWILNQASGLMVILAVLSVAWALLLRGPFQFTWTLEATRLTAVWKGLWVLAFPIPLSLILARTCQIGRQRVEVLLDRLPVRPQDASSARVALAFRFGLPIWLTVALILVAGLPFEVWFPWLVVNTAIFCSMLLVFTSVWASARKGVFSKISFQSRFVFVTAVLGSIFLLGSTWKLPRLVEFCVVLILVGAAVFIRGVANQIAALGALGLAEPLEGTPWWWPRRDYLEAIFYLCLLTMDHPWATAYLALAVVTAVAQTVVTMRSEWEIYRNCKEVDLEYTSSFHELTSPLLIIIFIGPVVLYRVLKYIQLSKDPTTPAGELAQSIQSFDLQIWLFIAGFGLTLVAVVYTIQKTRELLAVFRRRDTVLLRLPILLKDVIHTRMRQWSLRLVMPILTLGILDVVVILLNDTDQYGWSWIALLIGIQGYILGMGTFLFHSAAKPQFRDSEGHRV